MGSGIGYDTVPIPYPETRFIFGYLPKPYGMYGWIPENKSGRLDMGSRMDRTPELRTGIRLF